MKSPPVSACRPTARLGRLERVRLAADEPVALEVCYWSAEEYPALMNAPLDKVSLFSVLEHECGVELAYADEEIDATDADPRMAELLVLPRGTPLLPHAPAHLLFHRPRHRLRHRLLPLRPPHPPHPPLSLAPPVPPSATSVTHPPPRPSLEWISFGPLRRNRPPLDPSFAMPTALRKLFNDHADHVRGKVAGIYALLILINAAAWLWAVAAFHHFPVLLGTAFLAYSFGLRHAVDADHIAAIDNVTRKLMQEGKRPVAVGFMFSLGHSTIVIIGSLLIAAAALGLQQHIDHYRSIGGVIGTLRLRALSPCYCHRQHRHPALRLSHLHSRPPRRALR